MAGPTDEAEAAAERLEAALERIARVARAPRAETGPDLPELKDRLDRIIARLRGALEAQD